MNTKNLSSIYGAYAIAGSILYCITAIIFFNNAEFSNLWILYVGNFIFMILIFFSVIAINKRFGENASLSSLLIPGIKVTLISIAITCAILIIISFADKRIQLQEAPVNIVKDKSNGLRSILFMDAILVNFFVGLFAAFITSVIIQQNQKATRGNMAG
jgi:ABC-type Fe3+-siderophore transport system permease subunit